MSSPSVRLDGPKLFSVRMHATALDGMHISGAEGIFPGSAEMLNLEQGSIISMYLS